MSTTASASADTTTLPLDARPPQKEQKALSASVAEGNKQHESPPPPSASTPDTLVLRLPPPAVVSPRELALKRPDLTQRSVTDPSPTLPSPDYSLATPPQLPSTNGPRRSHSPYSRSHLRSRSGGSSLLSAPLMMRAKSMPSPPTSKGVDGPLLNVSSLSSAPHNIAQKTPPRLRSPFNPNQESHGVTSPPPRSPVWSERNFESSLALSSGVPTIEEDSELDITPRQRGLALHSPLPAASAAFSRSASLRRRPASPLQHSIALGAPSPPTSHPTTADSSSASSPTLAPQRYINEAYPGLHHSASTSSFSASSVPSTPSSIRSRSPSISSLDTIEDAPDAESAAAATAESERLRRMQAAVDTHERLKRAGLEIDDGDVSEDGGTRRRSSLESGRMGRGLGRPAIPSGERKRWSICGGERRGDLDLETIWED